MTDILRERDERGAYIVPYRVAPHWSVSVERAGKNIVTIESNCLSGRDLSAEDKETIRTSARNLLAFVGAPVDEPQSDDARILMPEGSQATGSAPKSSSVARLTALEGKLDGCVI